MVNEGKLKGTLTDTYSLKGVLEDCGVLTGKITLAYDTGVQEQSDWLETNTKRPSYIKNKPNVITNVNGKLAEEDGSISLSLTDINEFDDFEELVTSKVKSYRTIYDLPNRGEEDRLYVVLEENASYRWCEEDLKYYCVGRDYTEINTISGGNA